MLRQRLSDALKVAMKSKARLATSTLRLILAAVKDRDIAARGKGNADGISDDAVMSVLQTMVRQRDESIVFYEKGERPELAEKEAQEIAVIRRFLPEQMDEEQLATAVTETVDELGAASLKDMGRTMALLRERYAGRMDFAKANVLVKARLAGG